MFGLRSFVLQDKLSALTREGAGSHRFNLALFPTGHTPIRGHSTVEN